MSEFIRHNPSDRGDNQLSGFDMGDIVFLESLNLQANEQFDAIDRQHHQFDLELYRERYGEVVCQREERIFGYMEGSNKSCLAETVGPDEELTMHASGTTSTYCSIHRQNQIWLPKKLLTPSG